MFPPVAPAAPSPSCAYTKYSNLNSHFNLHEFYINFSFAKVTGENTQIVEIFAMKFKRNLELRATHSASQTIPTLQTLASATAYEI